MAERDDVDGAPLRLLFIAGFGRSGSTLLSRMLGQAPGSHAMGEIVHLWKRGLRENEACGCGQPFLSCAFWTAVGQEAFGGWDQVDVDAVLATQAAVERDRYLPWLLRPGLNPRFAADLGRYTEVLGSLYRAIQVVSGASVLVDSGKHVTSAFLLRHLPDIDLRIVHLVRDSRGVAHSWTKVMRRSGVGDSAYMARWQPTQTALRYLLYNSLLHGLQLAGRPQLLVRYEDLIAGPQRELAKVWRFCGVTAVNEPSFSDDGSVELLENHQVGGNPMRFRIGRVSLIADEAWRESMPVRSRILVTALTWPLLVGYGYLRTRGFSTSHRIANSQRATS